MAKTSTWKNLNGNSSIWRVFSSQRFFIHMLIAPCRIIFLHPNSKLSQGFSTLWYVLCTYLGICFCVCPFFNTMCFFKCSRLELGRWVSFDGYFQVMASKRYKLIRYRNMTGRVWIWILKFHLWWMNLLKYLYGFWFILCKRWGVLHSFTSMNTEHGL